MKVISGNGNISVIERSAPSGKQHQLFKKLTQKETKKKLQKRCRWQIIVLRV